MGEYFCLFYNNGIRADPEWWPTERWPGLSQLWPKRIQIGAAIAWVKPAVTNRTLELMGVQMQWNGFKAITRLWKFVPHRLYGQLMWGLLSKWALSPTKLVFWMSSFVYSITCNPYNNHYQIFQDQQFFDKYA